MFPEYSTKCSGEALMADSQMLFGLLDWEAFSGAAEPLCDYFPSSGRSLITVEFHLD